MAQIRLPSGEVVDKFYIANPGDITGGGGGTTQPANPTYSGTLAGTSFVQPMAGAPVPCTITLASTAGTRAIELSTDGGTNYFTPTYDANTTNMINVVVTGKVTHTRFTGIAGNTWSVL